MAASSAQASRAGTSQTRKRGEAAAGGEEGVRRQSKEGEQLLAGLATKLGNDSMGESEDEAEVGATKDPWNPPIEAVKVVPLPRQPETNQKRARRKKKGERVPFTVKLEMEAGQVCACLCVPFTSMCVWSSV